jgi:GNAT superfamily N-acetyltransferase
MKRESLAWTCRIESQSNGLVLKEVTEFIQRFSPHTDTLRLQFMEWKLASNPHGLGVLSTARTSNSGRIVSTCTISSRSVWHNGSEFLSAQIGDTFTDADYQRKGIFVTLVEKSRLKAESVGVKLIYGFPNANSLPGYVKKLGFVKVKNLSLSQFIMITDWYSYIEKKFFHAKKYKVERLESKVKRIIGGILPRIIIKTIKGMSFHATVYRVSESTTCENEIQNLWARAKIHMGSAIQRDSAYLRWRFLDNPYPYKVWVIHKNQRLVAYFVTLLVPYKGSDKLRRLILSDWVYEQSEGRPLQRAIINHTLDLALKFRPVCVTAIHSNATCQKLPFIKSGFLKSNFDRPVIVFGNEVGNSIAKDGKKWHLTSSDLDEF